MTANEIRTSSKQDLTRRLADIRELHKWGISDSTHEDEYRRINRRLDRIDVDDLS